MLTSARIEQVLRPQAQGWISSLRAPRMPQLAAEHGPFQPSLFDRRNLIKLTSEQFPGERLIPGRSRLAGEQSAAPRSRQGQGRWSNSVLPNRALSMPGNWPL